MSNAPQTNLPKPGTLVELVLDNSFVHHYLMPEAKHRSPPVLTIRGTVVPSVRGMEHLLAVQNSQTGVLNHINPQRILRINDRPVAVKRTEPRADRVVLIKSSRGNETYTVTLNGASGKWTCTCVGWQFKGKCRHVTQAAAG